MRVEASSSIIRPKIFPTLQERLHGGLGGGGDGEKRKREEGQAPVRGAVSVRCGVLEREMRVGSSEELN